MEIIKDTITFIMGLVDTVLSGAIALFLLLVIASITWWFVSGLIFNTKKHLINIAGFSSIFIVTFGFPIFIATTFPIPDTALVIIPLFILSLIMGFHVSKMIFKLDKEDTGD